MNHHLIAQRGSAPANAVLTFFVAVTTIVVTAAGARYLPISDIKEVISDAWFIFGLLAGAVLALIYRIFSDTSSVSKLTDAQRRILRSNVRLKVARLWLLLAVIVAPQIFMKVAAKLSESSAERWIVLAGFGLAALGLLWFVISVPRTWLEVRDFVLELGASAERKERADKQLTRLHEK